MSNSLAPSVSLQTNAGVNDLIVELRGCLDKAMSPQTPSSRCGFFLQYSRKMVGWHIMHRPRYSKKQIPQTFDSLATVSGTSPRPTSIPQKSRAHPIVAMMWRGHSRGDESGGPPREIVQNLIRCHELAYMLTECKSAFTSSNPGKNIPMPGLLCPTRDCGKVIDLSPVYKHIFGVAGGESQTDELPIWFLDCALCATSNTAASLVSQLTQEWTVQLLGSDTGGEKMRKKRKLSGAQRAIGEFIEACLTPRRDMMNPESPQSPEALVQQGVRAVVSGRRNLKSESSESLGKRLASTPDAVSEGSLFGMFASPQSSTSGSVSPIAPTQDNQRSGQTFNEARAENVSKELPIPRQTRSTTSIIGTKQQQIQQCTRSSLLWKSSESPVKYTQRKRKRAVLTEDTDDTQQGKRNWRRRSLRGTFLASDRDVEECNRQDPEPTWTPLLHTGIISDYFGLQRKYESTFIPLMIRSTLKEAQLDVMKVFKNFDVPTSLPDECCSDSLHSSKNEEVLSSHKRRSTCRSIEKKAVSKNALFGKEFTHQPIVYEKEGCAGDSYTETNIQIPLHQSLRVSPTANVARSCNFRRIHDGNDEFWEDILESPPDSGRRSRTTQMKDQKETSLLMLKEMIETLKWIEKYNNGPIGPPDTSLTDPVSDADPSLTNASQHPLDVDDKDTHIGEKSEIVLPKKKKGLAKDKKTKKEKSSTTALAPESTEYCPPFFAPQWDAFEGFSHVKEYRYRNQLGNSAVSLRGSIADVSGSIHEFLMSECAAATASNSVIEEEKDMSRAMRGYQGKADQERIETREHAEKSTEAMRFNRSRKEHSAAADAAQKLVLEPIVFESGTHRRVSAKKCCKKEHCPLCHGPQNDHSTFERSLVCNPFFEKKDLNSVVEASFDEDSTSSPKKKRPSRRVALLEQKGSAIEKLRELYHTLNFIVKYNVGMINTPGKNSWTWFYDVPPKRA